MNTSKDSDSPKKASAKKFWPTLVIILLLLVSVYMVKAEESATKPAEILEAKQSSGANRGALFSGVSEVGVEKLHQLFPEAKGKPLLVEFKSKFCLDCKRMTPILNKLFPHYSQMETRIYDIKNDRAKNQAVFNAFNPSIVPIIVFIDGNGRIQNVFYGYHPADELKKELDLLNAESSSVKGDTHAP